MGIITDIFLPLALAFIMFALGLALTGNDFIRVIKQPRDFFVGAFSGMVPLAVAGMGLTVALFLMRGRFGQDRG